MPEQRDPLDDALDDALATYGVAPENDGLEQRIVERVAERARHARSIKLLTSAVAAAAIVLIGCFFAWMVQKEASDGPPAMSLWRGHSRLLCRDSSRHPPAQVSKVRAPTIAVERRSVRKSAEPKLSRFPTPSPITSEERALVRLVTSNVKNPPLHPDTLGGSIKPIQITAIKIKPLGWEQ